MRHPCEKKSNVGRLRAYLSQHAYVNQHEKFDQLRFAALIGCSVHTLQSIETGRLKLSQELADRIARETGVGLRWLVDNNVKAPIARDFGPSPRSRGYQLNAPYKFEDYERAQASKIKPDEFEAEVLSAVYAAVHFAPMLQAILFSAHKRGRFSVAVWKVLKLLSDCRKQFGYDKRIMEIALTHARRSLKHRHHGKKAGKNVVIVATKRQPKKST
jgi:transcriptional regulator with XRE-family HTH domain